MGFDFDAWSNQCPPPDLDAPLDESGLDIDDLDKIGDLMGQWADYLSLRSDMERHKARGNTKAVDIVRARMERLYSEMPSWGQWKRAAGTGAASDAT